MRRKRLELILTALFGGVVVLLSWLGFEPGAVWTFPPNAQASTEKGPPIEELPAPGGLAIRSPIAGAQVWVGNNKPGETAAVEITLRP
jgi:hypothetical protein